MAILRTFIFGLVVGICLYLGFTWWFGMPEEAGLAGLSFLLGIAFVLMLDRARSRKSRTSARKGRDR